jgi:hypothetical protein
LTVDGIPIATPKTVHGVQGVIRTLSAPTPQTVGAGFQETAEQVTWEAENAAQSVPRNGQQWTAGGAVTGFSGTGYMEALPDIDINNNTGYDTLSPELQYAVRFADPGTYYVWVRAQAPNDAGDSVHVGIDGTIVDTADRISGFPAGGVFAWSNATMDNAPATLTVPAAGAHTINLWMREDGIRVDKILLTTDASYTPTGAGPAESASVGGTTYSFVSWSDGGAATHAVTTPAGNITYTATFQTGAAGNPPPAAPRGLRRRQSP